MRAVVIYESMFGNTKAIAEAVAEGLAERAEVAIYEVGTAPSPDALAVDLLVVGGPTHVHGASTAATRTSGLEQAGDRLVSRGEGIREWLGRLPAATVGSPVMAATFDTRIHGPGLLWGSAAKVFAKQLKKAGYRLVVEPESFHIDGPSGPIFDRLRPGELERARAWGVGLGERLRSAGGVGTAHGA